MRNMLAVLGLVAVMALPACAERRITVAQLKQVLADAQAAHQPDAAVARQLVGVALSERLSLATFDQLTASSSAPKTNEQLRVLADYAAFLALPPDETPARAAPDFAAQKAIMGLVVNYVVHTIPTLPNFMATRVTQHFSDRPDPAHPTGTMISGGLFRLGATRKTIAFRDGRESDDPAEQAIAAAKSGTQVNVATGLTSWGEFGPILSVVLLDAAKGKLGWARWETWNGKPVAVFQFTVAPAASHYTLQYRRSGPGDVVDSRYAPRNGRRGSSEGASAGMVKDKDSTVVRQAAGYHGTLTADPETGAILEITVEANLPPDDILRRADIVVQYAPVKVGESTFLCPIHSLAFSASMEPYQSTPIAPIGTVKELQLNDVTFTNYRRFGSEATLVMNGGDGAQGEPNSGSDADPAAPGAASAASDAGAAPVPANPSAPGQPTNPAAPPPAPAEEQEMSISAADVLPGAEPNTASPSPAGSQSSSFTLQVTTRLVDIGLVATDKHGKPITDLKPGEFELYDNGRRQQIASFTHIAPIEPGAAQAAAPQPTDTFTNAAPAASVQDSPDLLLLLLDESHLPFNDLNRARSEVLHFLKAARPDARLAIYSIGEHGFRVIQDVTADHALAETRLAKWMPTAAGIAQAAELETRNRQQFDTVRNPEDLNQVNGNNIEVPDYINSADPQLRQMGDNPLGAVLISMTALARHFASTGGHKSLVWISGDSVLYDWQDKKVSMERTVVNFDAAMNHTREALNEAHISLYAVDASSVDVGGAAVDPSLYSPNVEVSPVATCNSSPGGCGSNRIAATGRVTAQMQQDTRAIQTPVRLLAESTGGRAINKGSDLQKTLEGIEQESAALYEIAFNPDSPADNKFHTLELKLSSRKDIRLRYRTGYLYAEEATSAKDRFQEAVWSPQDLRGIALTAEPVKAADASSGAPTIRLRIAFPGLALKQEPQGASAGRWTDKLYIFLAQRDDAVRKAEVTGDTLQLALKQATFDTGMPAGIPYQREVAVHSKLGSVRVIVIDGNSGRIGSVTLPSSALQP